MTQPRALWKGARNCYVPKEVAVCPECGGELAARSMSNEVDTGRPIASAIEFDCMNDCRGGISHRWYQSTWQPIRDAVTVWSGARKDGPVQMASFQDRGLASTIFDRTQVESMYKAAPAMSHAKLMEMFCKLCLSHERLQQELDGVDALFRDEKAYASDLRKEAANELP